MAHPLLTMFHDAAEGRFPPVDGTVDFLPPLADGLEAVVGFTGYASIATGLSRQAFADLELDGFGAALDPQVLLRLAGDGTIYSNDITLVASGTGPDPGALAITDRWSDHPRVRLARTIRSEVEIRGDEFGFITMSRGLAGRREMGLELRPDRQGTGIGRQFIERTRRLLGPDQWLFAAVAPGNARSLRSFLSQGFVPIGTEILIEPNRR